MEQKDLFDIVFDKIKKISSPVMLILLMLIWQAVGVVILRILGITYDDLSDVLKVICLFIFDLLFLILLGYIYRKDLINEFKRFFNRDFFKNVKLSFRYWFIGLFIMVISNYIIAIITNGTLAGNEEAVRGLIDKVPIYMAFQVMLYAPLTEEIIFRKSIGKVVNNKLLFVIISGLVFGGLHVISSVTSWIDLIYLVPYCSLGFVFALLYSKTNNIFSTVIVHSFHNTLAFLLYLIG